MDFKRCLLAALLVFGCASAELTLCTTSQFSESCEQVKSKAKCVLKSSVTECLLGIRRGEVDITRASAEEALLAAKFLPDLEVIGEIIPKDELSSDEEYELVTLVLKSTYNGFEQLKGKRLCHPGFNFPNNMVTGYALQMVEKLLLKRLVIAPCADDESLLAEMHIKELNEVFGDSCRPGPWVANAEWDKLLQKKYPKMTALCPDEDHMDFNKTLQFLKQGKCDVAITTLRDFERFIPEKEKVYYKFLCSDVSSADTPCTSFNVAPWLRQPWPVILSSKERSQEVKNFFKEELKDFVVYKATPYNPTQRALSLQAALRNILLEDGKVLRMSTDPQSTQSIQEFMKKFREIPELNDAKVCSEMRWCTVSDMEQEKCLWLSQAAVNQGIQPVITCKQSTDKVKCLKDIENNIADVVAIEDHAYIAHRRKLEGISFTNTRDGLNKYAIVIKNSSSEEIQRLEDLKNKKGCFYEFGSNGWLAFIHLFREKKIFSTDTCKYTRLMADFLGSSCMPGAIDKEYYNFGDLIEDKMCNLCRPASFDNPEKVCTALIDNLYYNSSGALLCLEDQQGGDFAVINVNDIPQERSTDEFKILCRNGTVSPYTGFEVDDDCFMTVVSDMEVVTRKKEDSNPRFDDFVLVFEELESKFSFQTPFKIFDQFNGTKDLLFSDQTRGLETSNSSDPYVLNYINLFTKADEKCAASDPNAAIQIGPTTLLLTSLIFSFLPFIN